MPTQIFKPTQRKFTFTAIFAVISAIIANLTYYIKTITILYYPAIAFVTASTIYILILIIIASKKNEFGQ